jgi:pimeloyl-ACP methyl ester carboxylesterase
MFMNFVKICLFILSALIISSRVNAQDKTSAFFTETEIVLRTNSGGEIFGTLTVPETEKKTPLVIIIAGSGPTDRDCNSPLGVKSNAYKMLAEGLAKNPISSLRFDKRGIGKSAAAMTGEINLRFDTYINDVIDWVTYLKQDKRFSEIIILGHSEGSLIGMVAARKADVSKFISVAGLSRPADEIIKEQLKNQNLSQQLIDESDNILDSLKAGRTVSKVNLMLLSFYRPSVQPYMISWLKYNPSEEIKKLTIPVLIVQGTTDIQVPADEARLLSLAKPDARLLIIENMNHVLKEAGTDRQKNLATYTNPDLPLKPELLQGIVDFIKAKK